MEKTLEIKATLIDEDNEDDNCSESDNHIGIIDIDTRYYLVQDTKYYLVQAPKEIDEDITKKINTYALLRNLLEDCEGRGIILKEISLDYTNS